MLVNKTILWNQWDSAPFTGIELLLGERTRKNWRRQRRCDREGTNCFLLGRQEVRWKHRSRRRRAVIHTGSHPTPCSFSPGPQPPQDKAPSTHPSLMPQSKAVAMTKLYPKGKVPLPVLCPHLYLCGGQRLEPPCLQDKTHWGWSFRLTVHSAYFVWIGFSISISYST